MKEASKETVEKNQQAEAISKDSSVSAIRDIIFGENIQQYQREFNELRANIGDLGKHNSNEILALSNSINDRVDSLENQLNKSLDDLDKKITAELAKLQEQKLDRSVMSKALETIAKQL